MLRASALRLAVRHRVLCERLDITLAPGEIWGVLGPNGSGKSTLVHTLAGVREADGGMVQWEDRALADYGSRERARIVGLLPQHERAEFWGTVLDYALLGRYPQAASALAWDAEDVACARTALDTLGLAELAARDYGSLSGGERQRVRMAQLIAQSPRCLLLDEPLSHLDLQYQGRILSLLRTLAGQQRAVMVVLHDALWAARACSHVLLLDGQGGATSGPTDTVLTRNAVEALYGCPVRQFEDGGARYLVPEI